MSSAADPDVLSTEEEGRGGVAIIGSLPLIRKCQWNSKAETDIQRRITFNFVYFNCQWSLPLPVYALKKLTVK